MSDFKRRAALGLWLALAGCPDAPDDPGQTSKGGPSKPGAAPGVQPSLTAAQPTTGEDAGVSSSSSSTDDAGMHETTGADADTGSTTAAPAAACGDGVLDPGEQCDDGYRDNSDHAGKGCTASCQFAVCGDGLVWTDQEQCDLGANNNSSEQNYGGCTETCEFGPHCGDGLFQPDDEECDASAPQLEGAAACDPSTCRFKARVAFVTAKKFTGALGGLALADAACAAAAAAAGLDNSARFKAWLSDGVATPQQRLKHAAADPGYPYARRDGQLLADDLADLIAHGPKVPLDITETGAIVPPLQAVWTNVGADAQPFSAVNHCKEWTSEALILTARVGKVSPASLAELPAWKAARRWTSDTTLSCTFTARLYCFED